ncbi:MAG: ADP-ribosylglycohydrolase [Candidatus Parabeggiatoa sp. nov. 2]|nr:MAG: ADP-ribosylglycohydrolase [Beggiatoa sp. 4572_84]
MYSIERYCGSLLGLAVGDALGATLEFETPGSLTPITDMVGGGPFALKPGQWTDETSMALCLAESLIEKRGFDPVDQLTRYCQWYRKGYLSSLGKCFSIGMIVRGALEKFERSGEPYCGSSETYSAGNGSLIRLAPVPLFYARIPQQAIEKSGESSRTTHGVQTAIDACRYFGALLVGAVSGVDKQTLLSKRYSPALGYWEKHPLVKEIDEVACGSFKKKNPPVIRSTGYVVKSLEAALWAFYRSKTFESGALLAVNLGNDADATGAVYGQLAGAFYGEQAIPARWLERLSKRNLIKTYATILGKLGQKITTI